MKVRNFLRALEGGEANQSVKGGEDAKGKPFKKLIDYAGIDIVYPSYVMDCVQSRQLIPIEPKYLIHASVATKERLSLTHDQFGDSFTELLDDDETGLAQLKQVLEKVNPEHTAAALATLGDGGTGHGVLAANPLVLALRIGLVSQWAGNTSAD